VFKNLRIIDGMETGWRQTMLYRVLLNAEWRKKRGRVLEDTERYGAGTVFLVKCLIGRKVNCGATGRDLGLGWVLDRISQEQRKHGIHADHTTVVSISTTAIRHRSGTRLEQSNIDGPMTAISSLGVTLTARAASETEKIDGAVAVLRPQLREDPRRES
jgi:hypothetical protein